MFHFIDKFANEGTLSKSFQNVSFLLIMAIKIVIGVAFDRRCLENRRLFLFA